MNLSTNVTYMNDFIAPVRLQHCWCDGRKQSYVRRGYETIPLRQTIKDKNDPRPTTDQNREKGGTTFVCGVPELKRPGR